MTDPIEHGTAPLTGGCQCGAIRYAISPGAMTAVTCHCRDCQYACGGAPAHAIVVPAERLSIVEGEPQRFAFRADSGALIFRSFCPRCGTPMFGGKDAGGGYVHIKAGSLDDPESFRPRMAIWTAAAPSWHQIDPGIPHFAENPPASGS